MSYASTYAKLFGWVFIAVGLVGIAITGFGDVFGMNGDHLLFFEINPAHNIVHLLLGTVYLLGARGSEHTTRNTVLVLSLAYLLVGVLGIALANTTANILAINGADNVLHIGTGALGLLAVSASRSRMVPTTA